MASLIKRKPIHYLIMRSIKKVYELIHFLEEVGNDIENEKAEHNQIEALNAMYNILIGKR